MKRKVILLTEVISPYRISVFNEISSHLGRDFLVFFLSETVKERKWKVYKEAMEFDYLVLPSFSWRLKENNFPSFFNFTVLFVLARYSPDIIIMGGYHHPTSLLALLYARLFRKKFILWCESNKYDRRSGSRFNEAYKRWFVRKCTGYIVPGKASFEYLVSLGAAPDKICIAPNAVDNDHFSSSCAAYRKDKAKIRGSRGYPDKLILYAGRLIDEKGVPDLLEAFKILFHEEAGIGLLLVGSGEGEGRYKEFCRENNLKNVFFTGFLQQEELPLYYALSDIFILPTHSDPWGLVLNEAMACGLPVISSNVAGAAQDLIVQGKNGYIFNKGDIGQLSGYIKELLNDGDKMKRMGQSSSEIIRNYSPFKCAEGFIRAIREI